MSSNQQCEPKKKKKIAKQGSTNASGQSSLRIVFSFFSIVLYKQ